METVAIVVVGLGFGTLVWSLLWRRADSTKADSSSPWSQWQADYKRRASRLAGSLLPIALVLIVIGGIAWALSANS